jgi:hypothetical protein
VLVSERDEDRAGPHLADRSERRRLDGENDIGITKELSSIGCERDVAVGFVRQSDSLAGTALHVQPCAQFDEAGNNSRNHYNHSDPPFPR